MKSWLKYCFLGVIAYIWSLGSACAASVQTGNVIIEGEQLNSLNSGNFVYEIPGVGTLSLSGAGFCSYEYSKAPWWPNTKRHRLVVGVGKGQISWCSAYSDKRIVLTQIKLSGYAYGKFDFSDVIVNNVKSRWNTDGFNVSAYTTDASGVFTENQIPLEVVGDPVGVTKIEFSYEIYDYQDVIEIRADEQPQWTDISYTDCPVLGRKLYQGWNTLCLPFSCLASELGEGVVVQQFSSYVPAEGLSFTIVDRLEPNVPYLVYCPQDIEAGTMFSPRFVYPAESKDVQISGVHFVSNYQPGYSMTGKYGVANGRLLPGGEHAYIQGTSAYFIIESMSDEVNKVVHFEGEEGGTTAITVPQEVVGFSDASDCIYDFNGRIVGHGKNTLNLLAPGIYIYQGHKYLVK